MSVVCKVCTKHHHDHWECGNCGFTLGHVARAFTEQRVNGSRVKVQFKFCPECGAALE